MNLARSSSSEGRAATALTPASSSTVSPIAPPRTTSLPFFLAQATAALAAAIGSPE